MQCQRSGSGSSRDSLTSDGEMLAKGRANGDTFYRQIEGRETTTGGAAWSPGGIHRRPLGRYRSPTGKRQRDHTTGSKRGTPLRNSSATLRQFRHRICRYLCQNCLGGSVLWGLSCLFGRFLRSPSREGRLASRFTVGTSRQNSAIFRTHHCYCAAIDSLQGSTNGMKILTGRRMATKPVSFESGQQGVRRKESAGGREDGWTDTMGPFALNRSTLYRYRTLFGMSLNDFHRSITPTFSAMPSRALLSIRPRSRSPASGKQVC